MARTQLANASIILTDASRNIPPDWDWKTLASIAKTGSGGTPSRRNPEYFNGDIPWIKSGELNNGLILDSEEKITRDAIKNSSAKLLPTGTLLIAMYGATVGKLGILDIEGATNQAVCSIFPDSSIDKKFLFYFLKSIRNSLLERSFGGAQPNISQAVIRSIKVPVPPTTEIQRRIVLRIEALLHEVQESRKICDYIQQDINRLLEVAINEVLTKLESIIEITPFQDIATAFNGRASGSGISDVRVFKTKHVYPHKLRLDKSSYAKPEKAPELPKERFLRPGDVLMANMAEGTLGRVTYVHECEENWTVDTQIMILRPKDENEVLGKWLYYYFWSERGQREILSRRSGIAFADKRGQTHIYPKDMHLIPFPKMPISAQRQAVAYLDTVLNESEKMTELVQQDIKTLDLLEQSILDRAFRGEL